MKNKAVFITLGVVSIVSITSAKEAKDYIDKLMQEENLFISKDILRGAFIAACMLFLKRPIEKNKIIEEKK